MSPPALTSSKKNHWNSSSVKRSPSTSALTKMVARSSPGAVRFLSATDCPYVNISPIAAILTSGGATASSLVCMISVRLYRRSPSSRGMPINSAIKPDGKRPAISLTKSHEPFCIAASKISRASSSMRGRSSGAFFGVKPRETNNLNRSCCGGSMLSIIRRCAYSPIGSGSGNITPVSYELKILGVRLIARMSSYLVMAQKPGPSGSSCQKTGALARSHSYWSHG